MLLKIKNPFAGQCKYHLSTLAAFGAGLGAAVGYGLIPWYWLLIAALLTLFLNRWQLLTALAVFFICMCSGLLNRYINDTAAARIPSQRMRISGTLHCIDRRAANSKNLPPLKTVRCIALCGENEFEATVLLPENCNFSYSESRRFSGLIYPASASGLVCENGNIIVYTGFNKENRLAHSVFNSLGVR